MTGFLRLFRRFPQINVGGDSVHFPPLENAPVSLASLARKRVGCDTSHRGPAVNAVEECRPQRSKQIKDVVTFRRFIFKALRVAVVIFFDEGEGRAAHDVETCPMVEDLLQGIMD